LKAPAQKPKPVVYDPNAPLYRFQEAISRGFWGFGDRSILSMNEPSDSDDLLRNLQQIEDFCMSQLYFASSSLTRTTDMFALRRRSLGSTGDALAISFSEIGSHVETDADTDNGTIPAEDPSDAMIANNTAGKSQSVGSNGLSGPARTMNSFRDFRQELIDFYQTNNPSQLNKVDALLAKFAGKEEQLLKDLNRMYVE
jgi:hypothetical protein